MTQTTTRRLAHEIEGIRQLITMDYSDIEIACILDAVTIEDAAIMKVAIDRKESVVSVRRAYRRGKGHQ